ncbi:DUF2339 domain-containing protein [Proteobacteria bacterium 005FR1]|nr:DUF2339 domain-containing protein [Proteobacteria bacterium 005FR1]
MNKRVVFALVGIFAGAVILSAPAGLMVGGLLGFLLGRVFELAEQITSLQREVAELRHRGIDPQTERAPSPQTVASSRETSVQPTPEVPASVSPTPRKSEAVQQAAGTEWRFSEPAFSRPAILDKAFDWLRRFFTEGNPIVRIGVVVLFFGLSFLVKYASSAGLLPVELRLAAIAAVAIVLMVVGWKTRHRHGGYGLVLQGGGVAALYLTVFAANKFYTLMPSEAAFGLMFVVVMLGAALAILQNAQVLALMATAGGFLAPILTSDGSGNHVALFSFYLLLNLGVLAISWFKAWRLLNWVGFVFTFVISSAWGVLSYEVQHYASTQPFLIAFFVLYLSVSVLFSLRQSPKLSGLVDGSLVFGLPVVAFGLQAGLVRHIEYGMAISALVLAMLYLGLASFLWQRYRQTHRLLAESFLALGMVFATLAVPLALDAQWTSATWAIEAAGLVWVGLRQQRLLPRLAGYLLYLAGAASLLIDGELQTGSLPLVSGDFPGLVILAAAAFAIAFVLQRHAGRLSRFEAGMEGMALSAGFAWWLLAGTNEIFAHLGETHYFPGLLLFFSASVLAALLLVPVLDWSRLQRLGYALLPLAAFWALSNLLWWLFAGNSLHPFRSWGVVAVTAFVAVQYLFLWRGQHSASRRLLGSWHVLSAWLLLVVFYWEALWWQDYFALSSTSASVLWFACLALPLVALMAVRDKVRWPFAAHDLAYRTIAPGPLVFFLLFWFAVGCFNPGATQQLHLPLLNPLDLAQLAAIVLLTYLFKNDLAALGRAEPALRYGLLGFAGFIWLNVALLRSIHHHAGVDYSPSALWQSATVQMALSILWSFCALVVMNVSRRLQNRRLWILGAALLGLVLLKLFTKDLTGTGTLARIISFMVVGALMLLIGYLSPIPAGAESRPSGKAGEGAV